MDCNYRYSFLLMLIIKCCVYVSCRFEENNFSKDEENMLNDFAQHLNIARCIILVEKQASTIGINPSIFKNSFSQKMFIGVKTEQRFFEYLSFHKDDKTLVVYKSSVNVPVIEYYFGILKKNRRLHVVSKLTWLIIIYPWQVNDINFTIPYDCNFFLVHRLYLSIFKVNKIYSLGTNLIFSYYGILNGMNHDHDLAVIQRFPDKMDANQTEYTVIVEEKCIEDEKNFVPTADNPVYNCVWNLFLRDIFRLMNFRINEIDYNTTLGNSDNSGTRVFKFSLIPNIYKTSGDSVISGRDIILRVVSVAPDDYKNLLESHTWKIGKHWPMYKMKLFIKYPEIKKTSDFYVRPFEKRMWIAILTAIIAGGLYCALLNYSNRNGTKNHDVIDYFLLPFASLCYQGEYYDRNITFRTCCLIFRVLGIFIIGSYSADITAYLSLQTLILPFKSFQEFAENKEYKLLVQADFLDNEYFLDNKSETVVTGWKSLTTRKIRDGLVEYYFSESDARRKLCRNEKLVSLHLEYGLNGNLNCSLVSIPDPGDTFYSIFLFFKESPYTDLMNHKLLQARESGTILRIEKLSKNIWDKKFQADEKEDLETVGIEQLFQIFSFLGVACNIVLILLIIEFLIQRTRKFLERRKINGFK